MKNFLGYLGKTLFTFISSVGAFSMAKEGIEFLVGILVIVVFIYIVWLIFSEQENKLESIIAVLTGLIGGLVAAASMT
ncbi:hypothetical protein [Roseofilum capinflatum]|uniref:Uncharacterized protein n=1 Tax=Roseofilum capinflatum BLCC-M114 TaxID=3022440 RepID=A0ABT7B534_9CYAN|nr:hypothetical protein [Roseofilum capinflatum]MDJ1174288.1 hypothetical protein [Roseofilum capinflatum BLCC-M114]